MGKVTLEYGKRYRHRHGVWYLCLAAWPEKGRYRVVDPGGQTKWIWNVRETENGGLDWDIFEPKAEGEEGE